MEMIGTLRSQEPRVFRGAGLGTESSEQGHRVNADESASADEAYQVIRAQGGDKVAFEQLYRNHVDRVYALCLRMTGNAGLAEELTQDSFVRAWDKLGKFKRKSAFGTWLYRVALNVVLGHLRTEARSAARVISIHDLNVPPAAARTATPGTRVDLQAAIDTLPEGARVVFMLFENEGFQHKEIGKMLGISPGASKAQLHRARKLLREFLK